MSAAAVAQASPRAPVPATPSTRTDRDGGDSLPPGAFFAALAPHCASEGESAYAAVIDRARDCGARAGRVAWQSARLQSSPALSKLRKGGMKTGRRKRSRKRRMEAALAGFKPSVPDEFHFEPVNFDPLGLTTPLCKR